MNRRDFFKKSTAVAGAAGLSLLLDKTGLQAQAAVTAPSTESAAAGTAPELVAVTGGEPAEMFDKAIAALGGMERFVKKGQTVLLKPNMAWNRPPEVGANTNPDLVRRVAEHCVKAGGKVYVMDHNIQGPAPETSGIKAAAEAGGAIFVVGNDKSMYREVENPKAKSRKKIMVHQMVMDCDVLINIPVLKNHGGAKLTMALKNLMGCVYDRGSYHRDLDQSIVDFPFYRKPDLNILDAYRVVTKGGPSASRNYASIMPKMLLVSPDIVAVDTAGEAQAVAWGIVKPGEAGHVGLAAREGLGEGDLKKVKITKINI